MAIHQPASEPYSLAGRATMHMLIEFNDTSRPFPEKRSLAELFEGQVGRAPDAIAILDENEALTYSELSDRSDRIAHYLNKQGVRLGDCIPVAMSRSIQMVITQLAITKIGAVYVPIDPLQPSERTAFIVRDCGARWLIADQDVGVPAELDSVRCIDYDRELVGLRASKGRKRVQVKASSAAYVMYTSGSTGTPKGVVVPHRAVSRLVINCGYVQIEPTDCIAHCSNPAFDASTFEIWGALLNGARVLIVPPPIVLQARLFSEILLKQRVSILWLTIGLLAQYADSLAHAFSRLRYLITGGDVVTSEVIRRVLRNGPPRHLLSAYGPTECTTFSTTYSIEEISDLVRCVPIGRPISNTRVFILDEQLQPVPIGVVGEIYIGGLGVATGYINRPGLTAERFIANPFEMEVAARLYKSGDLGRWREDGAIEFDGRHDQQVKIRGYRIELGEVEAGLRECPGVTDAVAITRNFHSREKRIIAYVTMDDAQASDGSTIQSTMISGLRRRLSQRLPEYMVPSVIVKLDTLPLTANGKVDRRALPAPDLRGSSAQEYVHPEGEEEEMLAEIWQEVLGVVPVGRNDNFFELGGHSLLVVQMIEQLAEKGIEVDVLDVHSSGSLSVLAASLLNQRVHSVDAPRSIPLGCQSISAEMLPLIELQQSHIDDIVRTVPGGAENVHDIYPLTPLQEGMLFHSVVRADGGDTYVLPTLFSFPSRSTLERFLAALEIVIERHDILRTAILWECLPRPVQVIYRRATVPVEELRLDVDRDAVEQMKERMHPGVQAINLQKAPLMKIQIAEHPADDRWYVLFQLHHLLCDNESLRIMVSEVTDIMSGRAPDLLNPEAFRLHVAQVLADQEACGTEAFFREKFGDVSEPTAPFGLLDVYAGGSRIHEAKYAIDSRLGRAIRDQAKHSNVSPATLFHAAWALVISRTTGRDDVIYGTVMLGRFRAGRGARRALGMFLNTLPLRFRLRDISAKTLVRLAQGELLESLKHEQANLSMAKKCSQIAGAIPLFTTVLNFQHDSLALRELWEAVPGVEVLATHEATNYPIFMSVDDQGDAFVLNAQTDSSIDPDRMIAYLRTALESLVDCLATTPHKAALSLRTVPEDEQRKIIADFNETYITSPSLRPVHVLFAEQAREHPATMAVEFHDQSLTYVELERRSNQLAVYLTEHGVELDKSVALYVDRSVEVVVGLLGILKAGGVYVPIDPSYPPQRVAYMLEDARPRVVLTHARMRRSLPASTAEVIEIDGDWRETVVAGQGGLVPWLPNSTPDSLAYVIYTSGSTGVPKGTSVAHRSLSNLIQWHRRTLPCEGKRVLQFSALSFDVSIQEIFSTLCDGGTLVLLDEGERRDIQALSRVLTDQAIQRLFLPPLMLQGLAEWSQRMTTVPENLQDVITAGEQLHVTPAIVEFFERTKGCRLHNHYGPTETHVVTALTMDGHPGGWPLLPDIGRPIANARIYVLDAYGQPTPMSVPGEIYIAGEGVARGYMNRAALTATRFVPDEWSQLPSTRLYRTGDLGRWRPDGRLEYLGRNDHQVKIRGFRIELGEVESLLARHQGVMQVAVLAREDVPGAKRLVAYVAPRKHTSLSVETLREELGAMLPDFMVPSAFVLLDSLPVTPSGKVDRSSLPQPDSSAYVSTAYEAPQGQVEQRLARIWEELLRVQRVGRRDDFFSLGGHSLLMMQLVSRVEAQLSVRLNIALILKNSDILRLARVVDAMRSAQQGEEGVDQGEVIII